MSAADLFKAPYDVEFRLKGTYIMIGRTPYFVNQAYGVTGNVKDTVLHLTDPKGDEIKVELGRLPLRTMTDCPSGWHEGTWYTRGPARHRYQGITASSLWNVLPNGSVDNCGVSNVKQVLSYLAIQPKTRRPGKRPSGAVTRDVLIGGRDGRVYVRGRLRGEYKGENTYKPIGETNPLVERLFLNAKLFASNCEELERFQELEATNPCSEMILPQAGVW